MSRFTSLLKGLEEVSPQIKGFLKNSAEELKVLQQDPEKNAKRIEELSANIRNTVEANAKRSGIGDTTRAVRAGDVLQEGAQPIKVITPNSAPEIKINPKDEGYNSSYKTIFNRGIAAAPAAGMGLANPLDQIKQGYNKFEDTRGKLVDYLADKTAIKSGIPEVDQRTVNIGRGAMDAMTDPIGLATGAGPVDAALGMATGAAEGQDLSKFKKLFTDEPMFQEPENKKPANPLVYRKP